RATGRDCDRSRRRARARAPRSPCETRAPPRRRRRCASAFPGTPRPQIASPRESRREGRERWRGSSDDSWHLEKARVNRCVRRVGQDVAAIETRRLFIIPLGFVARDDVRGRGHSGRIDLPHLIGVGEKVAELLCKEIQLRGLELEIREGGDRLDFFSCECCRHDKFYNVRMATIRPAAVAGSWY